MRLPQRPTIEPLEPRRLLSAAAKDTAPAPLAALPAKQMEFLNRGLVVVKRTSTSAYIGWRLLGTDASTVAFNVYRTANGAAPVKLNGSPITNTTDFTDTTLTVAAANTYTVRPVVGGVEQPASESFVLPANAPVQQFLNVPLQIPAGGTTPAAEAYTYNVNDTSVGDLDGDGDYEYVVKWDPSNSKDNSQDGYTGNVYLDAYQQNGTRLWRIDLGINIRAGAHYTQFIVYDLDGDGRAEVACKTAPGTKDGLGSNVILPGDNPNADYRNTAGRILSGPEYLTIFNGQTGAAMATTGYVVPRGSVGSWGDTYGNRVDRFLATVAYLDGQRPSLVMARGYYERSTLSAWDWRNGQLTQRWVFDSEDGTPGNLAYSGQGTHNISAADVDGDGRDEIVYGAATIDDNGTGLYSTGLGHGDALHVSDMIPSRPGLEVFQVHESPAAYGTTGGTLRDAATGEVIVGMPTTGDVGRGVALDIDPRYPGYEIWNSSTPDIYSSNGTVIQPRGNVFQNFGLWWDADPLRELLDGTTIADWRIDATTGVGGRVNYVFAPAGVASNNGTKATPALSGDLLGDWREEVIWRRADNTALQIWTTTIGSTMRLHTLMHDPQYRVAIAWQNAAYNQPPHPIFFLGDGMATPPAPNIYLADGNPPPVDPNVYPAEGAAVGGGSVYESSNAGFNGTGYVNSSPTGGFLQFNNVDGGATAAMRTIDIRFALGAAAPRTGRLIVNGVARDVTFNTTGAWTIWHTLSVNVPLNAGATNTIRFDTIGQDLANIDEIHVDLGVKTGSVSGQVFHDTDANDLLAGEPTLNGVSVYIDSNVNGALDAGELTAVTSGAGSYTFGALPDGAYVVRAIAPAGFAASNFGQPAVASGGAAGGVNLANARIVYTSSSGADNYRVRKNGAGKYEILIGGSLAYTVFAAVPSLTFNLGDGNDTLTIDLANGAPAPVGGLTFDGGAGVDAIAVVGSPADDAVQFTATGLSLGAGSIAHAGVENGRFDTGGGWDSLTVNGGPAVTLVPAQQFTSLVLGAGASVALHAADSVLLARLLEITGGSRLDLADNDLLVDYGPSDPSPYAQIRQYVIDGLATPPTGIDSSSSTGDTVLAVVDNTAFGRTQWNGISIDATTIIGKYTYYGDANLDGRVTSDDYVAVDVGLGVGNSWVQGDFNFSGTVTSDDYVAIDANLGKGIVVPSATTQDTAAIVTTSASIPSDAEPLAAIVDGAAAETYTVRPKKVRSVRAGRSK